MNSSRQGRPKAVVASILAVVSVPLVSLAQDFSPPPTVTPDTEAGWTPFQGDEDEAFALTRRYLAALDEGRYDDAYAMQAPAMVALSSRSDWGKMIRALNDRTGTVLSRRVTAITWTHHGEGGANPGTFAAIDLVGRFTRADRECAYLILFRPLAGESLQVLRIQTGFLPNDLAERIAAQEGPGVVEQAWHAVAKLYPHRPDHPASAP